MTTVNALKNLYTALGGDSADVADISTNPDMINALCDVASGGNPNSKETITGTLANPFGESQVSFTEAKAAIANGGMSGLASVTNQGTKTGGLVLYADETSVYLIGTQYDESIGFVDTVIAWGSDWTLQYSVQGIMGSVEVLPGTAAVVIDLFIHPMPDNS